MRKHREAVQKRQEAKGGKERWRRKRRSPADAQIVIFILKNMMMPLREVKRNSGALRWTKQITFPALEVQNPSYSRIFHFFSETNSVGSL